MSARKIGLAEGAIVIAMVVMLAGLVVPAMRTWHVRSEDTRARVELEGIRDAIRRFMLDTRMPPTRTRDGLDGGLYRLVGPGLIAEGTYYASDQRQGNLGDHLITNQPCGTARPGYAGWQGPYLDQLTADPWGFAYFVVAYPLDRDDDRDAIVVSSGRNGRVDGSYDSPRDVVPAGDDLIEVIVDKSPDRHAPVTGGH